jgi:hypothetical protein
MIREGGISIRLRRKNAQIFVVGQILHNLLLHDLRASVDPTVRVG